MVAVLAWMVDCCQHKRQILSSGYPLPAWQSLSLSSGKAALGCVCCISHYSLSSHGHRPVVVKFFSPFTEGTLLSFNFPIIDLRISLISASYFLSPKKNKVNTFPRVPKPLCAPFVCLFVLYAN